MRLSRAGLIALPGICFLVSMAAAETAAPLRVAAQASASGETHGLTFGTEKRIEVLPVLFVPSDNREITPQAIDEISTRLYSHLELAQQRYRLALGTDTFKIADGKLRVYRSNKLNSYYDDLTWRNPSQPTSGPHDVVEAILKELFDWNHDNRYDSKYIYLVLYARPGPPVELGKGKFLGSAYPFNGLRLPNNGFGYSGGGYVGIDLSMLMFSKPHGFQDTFAHELGHALGLTHVVCSGYNMKRNLSVMSYHGQPEPEDLNVYSARSMPLSFNPEEYALLSQNKSAFPLFRYDEAKHNPAGRKFTRLEKCSLSNPMSAYMGPFKTLKGVGYELSVGGRVVSGGEQAFFTLKQAKEDCRRHETEKNVVCRFDGAVFDPGRGPSLPDLAGAWCDRPADAPVSAEKPVSIIQSGGSLTFKASTATSSSGHFESGDSEVVDMIVADDWDSGAPAFIRDNGKRLEWAGGSLWLRKDKCGS